MKIKETHIWYDKNDVKDGVVNKAYEEIVSTEITGIRLVLFWLVFIVNILFLLSAIGGILLYIVEPNVLKDFNDILKGTLLSLFSFGRYFVAWSLFLFSFLVINFYWVVGIINLKDDLSSSKNAFEKFLSGLVVLFIFTTPLDLEVIIQSILIVGVYIYVLIPIIDKEYLKIDKKYLSEQETRKYFPIETS